ncbi:hypothetical protein ACFQ71_02880 [Streptomyces sp. NPDC056534]|uniref:hypothetical protein n=1 Tax=Streptomyces sp. NPDC056534 TaxID=3345857 RepID=UPI003684C760
MSEKKQKREELWNRLRDLLNEMDEAGCSVHVGTERDASTNWMSIPYLVSQGTCTVEVMWNWHEKQWQRGRVRAKFKRGDRIYDKSALGRDVVTVMRYTAHGLIEIKNDAGQKGWINADDAQRANEGGR